MDAFHWLLLALAVLASALAVWALLRNASLAAHATGLRATADRAERDAQEARAAELSLQTRLDTVTRDCNAHENEVIRLQGLVASAARELDHAQQQHDARLGAEVRRVEEVFEAQRASFEARERDVRAQFERGLAAMEQRFAALADKSLRTSQQQFLEVATQNLATQNERAKGELQQSKAAIEAQLRPIADALQRTGATIAQLDKDRAHTQATLEEQLRSMRDASLRLSDETRRLGEALRKPDVRGRYGEMQLRRVVELAGMVEYCDFGTQETIRLRSDQQGEVSRQRPDMIVRLPSGRSVVVDAKCNIQSYLDALQAASPEMCEQHLARYAQHVAQQAMDLGKKEYWKHFDGSPDFVVMFVPGDQFLDAALARQPDLMEQAWNRQVMLASPATLIGLLRAIAVGYREEKLAKMAEDLRALGREFHDRMANALEPLAALGQQLDSAVRNYNRFVGSYEARLLPTLQKFEAQSVRGKKDIPALPALDAQARPFDGASARDVALPEVKRDTKSSPAPGSGHVLFFPSP